ncbi:MAG: hypothetical protein HN383_12060 [Verrucomicrobia bacterium]|jgi:hypothetical protein|nr:hypothetical protein [Verrucomicrobiota bacterium]MBT7700692.1 hypothetical protein [Verrucomicrobiota bacterium]
MMKTNRKQWSRATRGILAAAALCLLVPIAHGELLVHYGFDGEVLTPTSEHAQITASSLGALTGAYEYPAGADGTSDSYSRTRWFDTGNYYSFNIAVEPGFIAAVTNLSFYGRRVTTGPTNWTVRYSVDDSTYYDMGAGQNPKNFTVDPMDVTGVDLSDRTGTNYIRMYATNAVTDNGGIWGIDEVKLWGTVTPCIGADYIKYQGYDDAPHDDWGSTTNWNGGTILRSQAKSPTDSGSWAIELKGSATKQNPNIVFDNVSLVGISNASISVAFAATDVDTDSDLYLDISYDGGSTWSSNQLVDGFGGYDLDFGSVGTVTRVPGGANPFVTNLSASATQVMARIVFYDQADNPTNDYYYIDSVAVRGIPTPSSSASPEVSNYGGITDITTDSATVRGHVIAGYPYPAVTMYYGPVDGGGGLGSWSRSVDLGTKGWGVFTNTLTGLSAGTKYYYRCHVENSLGAKWADSSTNFVTTAGTLGAGSGIYIDELGVADVKPLSIDADGNGLSDRWEDTYLAGKTGEDATSGGDADGDGRSNLNEFYAGTDPDNSNSYMRIVGADLPAAASSDLAIQWIGGGFYGPTQFVNVGDAQLRTFSIRASDQAGENKSAYGTASGLLLATNTWIDTNAVNETAQRFYEISVSMAGSNLTNTQEWGMFVQPRAISNRYLVSVPVDLGTNNTLNGELGQQLARGLSYGSTITGDKLSLREDDGNEPEYVLISDGAGGVKWWHVATASEPTNTITPGMGMWLVREGEANEMRTNSVMVGRTYVSNVDPLTFNTNAPDEGWKWRIFGWPYAKAIASTGQSDPFGFYTNGAYGSIKGGHTADHEDKGDQIWVWDGERQRYRYYYLLSGVDGRSDLDGVWWDLPRRTNAVLSLEAGQAYLYRHHVATNGATTGTNFIWQPHIP